MSHPSPNYKFFPITSSTPNLTLLAQKHKALRLAALQLSPDSFSSTYDAESALPDSAWLSRLNVPGKTLFVCSVAALHHEDDEFAAVVTLIGPMTASAFALGADSGQPPVKADSIEQRWQLSSLYALPAHRGQSLGRKLCQYAIDQLRADTGVPELRFRLMIKPTNTVVIKMYERMGFEHSGRCTLEEAMTANGELDTLPSKAELDGQGEPAELLRRQFRTRLGLVMQQVVRQGQIN